VGGRQGDEAVVKLLLANDSVDPDSKNTEYDQAPLSWGVESGHEKAVKLLLDNKANADAEDKYGLTAVQLATFNFHEEVEQLLVEKEASTHKDFYGLQTFFLE
jgi:ankyrin repeat protein